MTYPRFCELLAEQIHTRIVKGDNQSTTTVCFNTSNRTIYVATQGDKLKLQHLLQPEEPQKQHRALLGKELDQGTSGGYKKLQVGQRRQPGPDEPPDAWQLVHETAYGMGYSAPLNAGNIAAVKWVTRFDFICDDTVFQGTGLHGESYIIRYLALKALRGVQELPVTPDVGQLERQASTDQLLLQLCNHFKQSYAGKLYMGSSQGACSRCAEFMTELAVGYQTKQDRDGERDDTWMHPFTMSTRASGYRLSNNSKLWLAPKLGAMKDAKARKNEMRID